ncbi:hypothetical protein LTR99_002168 [Exophiala xenobiotica]|uniref:25S rRNA (uridine-N(3))-methyltransferase BMT5-like domain-containing protein n=1 Tax=Vermiconidia calcicola TaxID=1690605 RepID=A0AAV9QFR6_9PEZI|nr:hypothetical protein H2202_010253 [Exophiala xenobiotica]KAK5539135.1 hypothetical protein LTR23_006749 [Chaetothyriales sp. CCFEE 6169]KAK5542493.1 hypothetical protein LTR25_002379 [Vermiconidia calcicola]KAK5195642.1 hypothetical protein LTR92_004582 [Exophiala xenobiotica]KAK5226053.1 hypothetical protein LTR72_003957 [Exophiala xenobiotica]
MGKVKRQAQKHSNHHDNPGKGKATVARRQHSQKPPQSAKKATAHAATNGASQARSNVPFTKHDNVLLIGEGDLSFSSSLRRHHKVNQITATCYDSKGTLESKYPNITTRLRRLEQSAREIAVVSQLEDLSTDNDNEDGEVEWKGFSPSPASPPPEQEDEQEESPWRNTPVNVLYGIDATKLSSTHKKVLGPVTPFTKIVFNFPHVGGLSTDVNRQVRYNQELLVGFFKAAKELLSSPSRPSRLIQSEEYDEDDDVSEDDYKRNPGAVRGQILVTLFEGEPYTLWNIRDLARHSGLKVVESFKFPWSAYPGYQHARTIGDVTTGKDRSEEGRRKGAWRGEEREARCFVLEDIKMEGGKRSRKRKHGSDDEDSE